MTGRRRSGALERQLFEGEEVVLITRHHSRRLWPTLVLLALASASGVFLLQQNAGEGRAVVVAGVALALLVGVFLWRILRWRRRRFIVTNRRLIHLWGVLNSRMSSAPLVSVRDLGCRQSLMGKLLRYGDVIVIAGDWKQRIGPLPRPQRILEAIAATCAWSSPGHLERPRASSAGAGVGDWHGELAAPRDTALLPAKTGAGKTHDRPLAGRRGRAWEGVLIHDRYLLDRKVASGGMGTVYQGVDQRLGRPVAIKVLKEELSEDGGVVERFRREARAAAALSHPNVTSIFDYGQDDGMPYIVMELVRGRDLGRELERDAPFSLRRAVQIECQVLEALQHAHEAGVVHRDVKPANVIVNERDRVKVTDFGIARAAGESRLTATGIILGSAHYVSPEHVKGEPSAPQSDIYSAGILLYEMLTGAPPFEGDSLLQVAELHLTGEVPPPSFVNSDIPPALDEVVIRATAKALEDRFSSAEEMAAALAACEQESTAVRAGHSRRLTRRLRSGGRVDTPELPRLSG